MSGSACCPAALAVLRVAIVVAISLARLPKERESLYLRMAEGLVLQLLTGVGKLRIANRTRTRAIWVEAFGKQGAILSRRKRAGNLQKELEAAFPALATLLIFALAQNASGPRPLQDLGTFLAFYAAFGLSLARSASGRWRLENCWLRFQGSSGSSRSSRRRPKSATSGGRLAKSNGSIELPKCRSATAKRAADSG